MKNLHRTNTNLRDSATFPATALAAPLATSTAAPAASPRARYGKTAIPVCPPSAWTGRNAFPALAVLLALLLATIGGILTPTVHAEIVPGAGYTFDTDTGALVISTDAGTTAWRSDTNINTNGTARLNAIVSVTLQDGVTTLGANAFQRCESLAAIHFPASGFTTIGSQVFEGCGKLTSIALPDSLTTIGAYAFIQSRITEITLPSGLLTIGRYAFYGSALTSITLPDSLTEVGDLAFYDCTALTVINLPVSGSPTWGDRVFYNTGITEINIPATLTTLGSGMFWSCAKLATVSIPDDTALTAIPDSAFRGCAALKTISLPANIKTIGDRAFYSSGLTSLPSMPGVTTIRGGEGAFRSCLSLAGTIVIPDHITSLGSWTFAGCANITGVTIGTGITTIPNSCFRGCSKLRTENITIPAVITGIAGEAFRNCDSLTDLPVMPSVIALGGPLETGVFADCDGLVNIHIPATLRVVGPAAFANCTRLQTVSIPATGIEFQGVFSGAEGTFEGCGALNNVVIPAGTIIPPNSHRMFGNCASLTNISLPDGLEHIGWYMFEKCTALTNITLPNTIRWISEGAFAESGLQTIAIPNGCSYIGPGAFQECASLQSINIPDTVSYIGGSAFEKCTALTTITLPPYLDYIGVYTFKQSGLTSIVIPSSCTGIGSYVFSDCNNLTSVTVPPSVTILPSSNPFHNATLTVAAGSTAETFAIANNIPYTNYSPPHVPVTDIAGAPFTDALAIGTYVLPTVQKVDDPYFYNNGSYDLSWTPVIVICPVVMPANASMKRIVWSVKNAGTTGAFLILSSVALPSKRDVTFRAAGTAVLTATISGGGANGADYTKDFTFNVGGNVPVTDITGIPTYAQVGVPLTLAGSVVPSNAQYQAITWSHDNYGVNTSGAQLYEGNKFFATRPGTVSLIATVLHGAGIGNFTKKIEITVGTDPTPPPVFIAVKNITDIPTAATVGAPLVLNGTVSPADANNRAITWSVKNAGATGATIDAGGNTLNTTAAGTVTVTATILNGASASTNYTQDFTITVSAPGSGHTHSFGSDWKKNSTTHWHECTSGDGAKSGSAAHTPGNWIIDAAATATADGSKHKECTVCGYVTATETIPANAVAEVPDFAGVAGKGVKLTAPKTLVVPKGTKLAKGAKAIYIWKKDGEIINKLDKKGNYVSAKTWTAKEDGDYSVELWYQILGDEEETVVPAPEMSGVAVRNFVLPKFPKKEGLVISARLDADGAAGVNPEENDPKAKNSVVQGEKLLLTARLDVGTGTFIYKWYKNNTKTLVKTTETTEMSDTLETDVFGAKTDGYFVTVETKARDAKGVKPLGTVKSATVKPKVILPPEITSLAAKPASAVTKKNVSLTAKVKGTAKLNYQWFKVEDGGGAPGGETLVEIPDALGGKKATLTLKKVTVENAGLYRVVVTNAAGAKYAKSAEVAITVDGFASAAEAEAAAAAAESGTGGSPVGKRPLLTPRTSPPASLPSMSPLVSTTSAARNTGEPPVPLYAAAVAPEVLTAGTIIEFEDGVNSDFTAPVVLEILSATELVRFAAAAPAANLADSAAAASAPANGEYTYIRTSDTTAILFYAIETSDGSISTGEILLEFADANGGSFSAAAEGEGGSGVFELHSGE